LNRAEGPERFGKIVSGKKRGEVERQKNSFETAANNRFVASKLQGYIVRR